MVAFPKPETTTLISSLPPGYRPRRQKPRCDSPLLSPAAICTTPSAISMSKSSLQVYLRSIPMLWLHDEHARESFLYLFFTNCSLPAPSEVRPATPSTEHARPSSSIVRPEVLLTHQVVRVSPTLHAKVLLRFLLELPCLPSTTRAESASTGKTILPFCFRCRPRINSTPITRAQVFDRRP